MRPSALMGILLLALLGATAGLVLSRALFPTPPVSAPPTDAALNVGDRVANFSFPDSEGQPRDFDEWQGQVRVLNFWATWCAPCRQEMPVLQDAHRRWQEQGVQILGIALDRPDLVREFLAEFGISYVNLLGDDRAQQLSRQLGNSRGALPFTVLIGRDGRLLQRHLGMMTGEQVDAWVADALARP